MSGFNKALAALTDKNGVPILPIISDMSGRENAVLIVNLACDDECAQINAHIATQYAETAAVGIASIARAGGCDEIIIYSGQTDASKLVEAVKTDIPVTVMQGPCSPVLRDETALYSVMDTGIIRVNRAELDYACGFLSYGYHGRPTLVIDGECAYQAGRLYGDQDAQMTKLVCVINGDTSVIKEVPVGTSAAELLKEYEISGQVLIGGTRGRLTAAEALEDTHIGFGHEYDSVKIFGGGDCIVNELASFYAKVRELSCGKCVMCREGSWQLSTILSDITTGRSKRDDIALVEDISPLVHVGALCLFGKNMVLPVMTAAALCREEFERHVIGRTCAAGRCAGLMKYVIDPAVCTGCGECIDACEEDAIDGKDGFIHVIDEAMCEKCGDCVSACEAGAIKLDGGNIRTPKKPIRVGRFN